MEGMIQPALEVTEILTRTFQLNENAGRNPTAFVDKAAHYCFEEVDRITEWSEPKVTAANLVGVSRPYSPELDRSRPNCLKVPYHIEGNQQSGAYGGRDWLVFSVTVKGQRTVPRTAEAYFWRHDSVPLGQPIQRTYAHDLPRNARVIKWRYKATISPASHTDAPSIEVSDMDPQKSSRQFKVISKMLEGGQIEIYADRQ